MSNPKFLFRRRLFVVMFALVLTTAFAVIFAGKFTAKAESSAFNSLFSGNGGNSSSFANLNLVIVVAQDGIQTLNTAADTLNTRNICAANPTPGCDFSQNDAVVRTNDSVVYTYDYNVNGASEDVTLTATAPIGTIWSVLPGFCLTGSTLSSGNGITTNSVISCKRGVKDQGTTESLPFTATVLGSTLHGIVLTATGAVAGPSSSTVNASAPNVTVTAAPRFNLRMAYQSNGDFTHLSVAGKRIEYRVYIETYDDSVPVALNPRYGSAALISPITFTDIVSAISPTALLQSCAKQSDNAGNGGTITCTQAGGAGTAISASVAGSDTTLSQYVTPGIGGRNITGTYQIYVFVPNTALPSPCGNFATNNTLQDFDPSSAVSPSGTNSNFGSQNEMTSDNAAATTTQVNNCSGTGNFNMGFTREYNTTSTNFTIQIGGNNFAAVGDKFAAQISVGNNTGATLNNVKQCAVLDNSKYSVVETPTAGVVHQSDAPAPTSIEFAAGYVNSNWQPTAVGGNPTGIRTECDDSSIVWYTNPLSVPGGLAAITKFRTNYNTITNGTTARVRVRVQARDTNFYNSQTIGNGATIANYGVWRSDELNQTYNSNTYYPNVYPNTSSGSTGGRVFLARATVRITKETEQNDTINSVATGGSIGFVLKPVLTTTGTVNPTQVTITDVLPVGLTYLGGTAQQNSVSFEPQIINCTGSTVPNSRCTATGQQILTWILNNQTPNVTIPPISYRTLADLTVLNNQTLINTAIVSSPADPVTESTRTATRNVIGASPSTLLIFKNTNTPQIEPNDTFRYTVSYRNASFVNDFTALDFIDVLPFNGDANLPFESNTHTRTPATSYNGTRALTSVAASTGTAVWYFTNAASNTINLSPKFADNLNPGQAGSIWCAGTVAGPSAGCGFTMSQVTAMRLRDNTLMPRNNSVRTFTLNFSSNGNAAGDVYTNNSGGSAAELALPISSNNVPVTVLDSSISGSVWFDTNADGVRGAAEVGRVTNSNIILQGTDSDGNNVNRSTTTDASGNYVFNNLASGNYTVQFTRPTNYAASPQDMGADDTADSDGSATTLITQSIALGVNEDKTNVDNGFYTLNLNGTIWRDTNNDGFINNGEAGIGSVAVELLNSGNTVVGSMNTDSNGEYLFVNLAAGDYRVRAASSGLSSSANTVIDPNNNADNDDNGIDGTGANAGKVISNPITLAAGTEPTINQNTGTTLNATLDLGLASITTAVKMREFYIFESDGKTVLNWQTSFEINNLGFRIYKQNGAEKELLNRELVAGSALTIGANEQLSAGNGYAWTSEKTDGANYILEAVDLDGGSEFFSPVYAAPAEFSSSENSPTLSQLAQNDSSVINRPLSVVRAIESKNNERATTNKSQIKIEVSRDGWHCVTHKQLAAAGFDVNSNSANWRLFADGAEQAVKLAADGAIEFYGRGLDTIQTDARIYWLAADEITGKRIVSETAEFDSNSHYGWFLNSVERRDRAIRVAAILNGADSNFYGGVISASGLNQFLTLDEIASDSGERAVVEINLQGLTAGSHAVEIQLNGEFVGTVNFNGRERKTFRAEIALENLRNGANTIGMLSAENTDASLLENVRIVYPRTFKASADKLNAVISANENVRLSGFNSKQIRVLDITDAENVKEFLLDGAEENGEFAFSLPATGAAREIVAAGINSLENLSPRSVSPDSASDLRNKQNTADFLIIAPRGFEKAVEPLRIKREAEGLQTKFIDIADVYDEFNSGARSADALKGFLQFASQNWKSKPQFVLLVGDASVDPRGFIGGAAADIVPTMMIDTDLQEAASDEAFVEGKMAIGRLPVRTADEANIIIAKILNAENISRSELLRRGALFVSDAPIGFDFANLSDKIINDLPVKIESAHINRDGDTPNAVRENIISRINSGAAFVNFYGHGSLNSWTSAGILRGSDVSRLRNQNSPMLMTMLSCLNGAFAETGGESLAEILLKSRTGGASAVWANTATSKGDGQEILAQKFYAQILNGERLGSAIRQIKQQSKDTDAGNTWIFFGDPTSRLFKTESK